VPTDPAFQPFRVELHEEADRIRVVPVGELDLATAPIVEERARAAWDHQTPLVVLDLREVTFMDSSGLRLILGWDAESRRDGTAFALIRGDATVQRVFEATLVAERLTFVEP
jgi:anti-sigma B factor antagonist